MADPNKQAHTSRLNRLQTEMLLLISTERTGTQPVREEREQGKEVERYRETESKWWQPKGLSGKAKEKGRTAETTTEQREADVSWHNVRNGLASALV